MSTNYHMGQPVAGALRNWKHSGWKHGAHFLSAHTIAPLQVLIRGLNKEFTMDGKRVPVLQGIDLTIRRGEFVCIVGGSGCGKSTLLRIIAGLENSYTGTEELDGRPITGPGTDRGFVFQEHRLLPWLTVGENIAFGWRGPKANRAREIQSHLDLVGLPAVGMAQRSGTRRDLSLSGWLREPRHFAPQTGRQFQSCHRRKICRPWHHRAEPHAYHPGIRAARAAGFSIYHGTYSG